MKSFGLELSRRQWVVGALLAPLISVLGFGCSGSHEIDRAEARLTALLRRQKTAIQLGNTYLSSEPTLEEMPTDQLTMLIIKRIGMEVAEFNQEETSVIKTRLSQKISDEFRDEDVVSVDGWLLARTEAQLLALLKLSSD